MRLPIPLLLVLVVISSPIAYGKTETVSPETIKKRKIVIHRSLLNIYKKKNKVKEALSEFKILFKLLPSDKRIRYEFQVFLKCNGLKDKRHNKNEIDKDNYRRDLDYFIDNEKLQIHSNQWS